MLRQASFVGLRVGRVLASYILLVLDMPSYNEFPATATLFVYVTCST
jgi:hypothetical protein